ncbi:hypothetical protein BT67DRAFT_433729 [Trichocladium antarcticum]|uniref:Uncharacterized protein n=1 Tax=Trichocladium antarcticum TaxID=1450529 RepID=A0AAN6UKX2_9PEZI|nr:hypothetical protein BT67DRAFT_433729 [Trichocladium antarcticum]
MIARLLCPVSPVLKIGLTTILRGFKVPIAILDRFLASNGAEETWGAAPSLIPNVRSNGIPLDPSSGYYLRTTLAAAGDSNSAARIFIPSRLGAALCTYAYVAYAYTREWRCVAGAVLLVDNNLTV